MFRRKHLTCSFCGKGEAEVVKLVAGPKVFICDECVATASRLMQGESPVQLTSKEDRRSILPTLWEQIRSAVRRRLGSPRSATRSRSSLTTMLCPRSLRF